MEGALETNTEGRVSKMVCSEVKGTVWVVRGKGITATEAGAEEGPEGGRGHNEVGDVRSKVDSDIAEARGGSRDKACSAFTKGSSRLYGIRGDQLNGAGKGGSIRSVITEEFLAVGSRGFRASIQVSLG